MPYVIAPGDLFLAPIGDVVHEGDVVKVPEDVAASLIEQGWEPSAEPDDKASAVAPTPDASADDEVHSHTKPQE